MNKKNINLLITRLEEQLDSPEAARFNMSHFGREFHRSMAGALPEVAPVCKTQACIAGEAILATGAGRIKADGGIEIIEKLGSYWYEYEYQIEGVAKRELGLTLIESKNLFFFRNWIGGRYGKSVGWPLKFQAMYEKAKTPQGRLYAAILRVQHFKKTGR